MITNPKGIPDPHYADPPDYPEEPAVMCDGCRRYVGESEARVVYEDGFEYVVCSDCG